MVNLKSKLKQAQKQRGALLVMNLVIIALCLVKAAKERFANNFKLKTVNSSEIGSRCIIVARTSLTRCQEAAA